MGCIFLPIRRGFFNRTRSISQRQSPTGVQGITNLGIREPKVVRGKAAVVQNPENQEAGGGASVIPGPERPVVRTEPGGELVLFVTWKVVARAIHARGIPGPKSGVTVTMCKCQNVYTRQ